MLEMKSYNKPLPVPTSDSEKYWEGCRKHELWIPKCLSCKRTFFYPSRYCPHCHASNHDWIKSEGKGTVYSYSIVCTSFYGPEWKEDLPYIVCVIELREGVRMLSNIINCKPDEVSIGAEVEGVFDDVTEEFSLPKFELCRNSQEANS